MVGVIFAALRNSQMEAPRMRLTSDLLQALGALHVECAVQVELVVELPDLVVLPRRLRPGKAAKRTEERE